MATKKASSTPAKKSAGSSQASTGSSGSTGSSTRTAGTPAGGSDQATAGAGTTPGLGSSTSGMSATSSTGTRSSSGATSQIGSQGSTQPGSQGGSSKSQNGSSKSQSSSSSKNSSKKENTLETLFEDLLNDVYSAETQLLEALPEIAEAAYSDDLREAVENHIHQTQKHVERLEKVFSKLRIEKEDKTCEAMKGLIKENKQVIEEFEEGPVRDSALIIGSQKVEHYEIASYGSLCELADVLGWKKVHEVLGRTLDEEEETDKLLTEIAMAVNDEAYEMSEEESEEEEIY